MHEHAEQNREKERRLTADPIEAYLRVERADPFLTYARTDKAEPQLMLALMDGVMKASPHDALILMLALEPSFIKERTDIAEPNTKESRADSVEAHLIGALTLSDEAKFVAPVLEMSDPILTSLLQRTEKLLQHRAIALIERQEPQTCPTSSNESALPKLA